MNLSFVDMRVCWCAVAALLLAGLGSEASGQTFPSKNIRLIVPFAAAGDTPEEFRAMIATEVKKWAAVVKAAGVRAEQ